MTETSHVRSRRASLVGLIVQILATAGAYILFNYLNSPPMAVLTALLAGGIPLWFVTLLVFRQRELAELEQLDLEELRKERASAGGTEAIFREGESSFRVAAARLSWMQKVLVPAFSVVTGLYLILVAIWHWTLLADLASQDLAPRVADDKLQLGLILTTILLVCLFFFSRYAVGLSRVSQWQMLRGGGSYMTGGTLATFALIITLGIEAYSNNHLQIIMGYVLAAFMLVLGVEMLLNFVLDFYRPRTEGQEHRAAFDSRLLGLISEPGGIAANVAEAVNYQFGFQVSQTWFYQLLQRTAIPLVLVGSAVLWGLTSIVIAQPYEHVIIERFGRQVNATEPYGPGLSLKLPWPIERARKYNTGQLHEFYIGFDDAYQPDEAYTAEAAADDAQPEVELWSDRQHAGRDHFDFVVSPTPYESIAAETEAPSMLDDSPERTAEHLARVRVVVQYRLAPDRLANYTQQVRDPDLMLKQLAWDEVSRFVVSNHIDALMGERRAEGGKEIKRRLGELVDEYDLGLEIVFVGLTSVHPHQQVAGAFRQVVTAQQDRLAKIREARVIENETLSAVAGDVERARRLAHLLSQIDELEPRRNELERALEDDLPRLSDAEREMLAGLDAPLRERREIELRLAQARRELAALEQDVELGLGSNLAALRETRREVAELEAELETAGAAYDEAVARVRTALEGRFDPDTASAVLALEAAQDSIEYWNQRLDQLLQRVEGQAAVLLSRARAKRWQQEMRAAGELVMMENERFAYRANPEIYKARLYYQALVNGLLDARKFVMSFDPQGATMHLRLNMEDNAAPDIATQSLTPERDFE